ncbi:MAG: Glu/Leu/Phe/Val dehydrogenase dimerization domain-containing protein [Desulfarculaceae bacterium]|jgi:glutamate dehydrogenase (NAD(P)+)
MIPASMRAFLDDKLPGHAFAGRRIKDGNRQYLELGGSDRQELARLGIKADRLGPFLVSCMWDQDSDLEIGGYLVVDNLSLGRPAMGGIRMLPGLTPDQVHNLARGMTLKNSAAGLAYGGGKSGIVADRSLKPQEHQEVIKGFARLISRYRDIYVPGPDVGVTDKDMKLVAIENGLNSAVSKPAEMGGCRIDELGGAAGGVVVALQTLLEVMPALKALPQFADLVIPEEPELTVLIQGFGAVGAHAARIIKEKLPRAKIIGISDREGYLYDENGLPVTELFDRWQEQGLVARSYFQEKIVPAGPSHSTKFSSDPDDLLRESAFCLVPAAPVFNYLGARPGDQACMCTQRMGKWSVIVEGANTYSPDPEKTAVREALEKIVFAEKGVMIANDYLVNSGGVIFAAQELAIPAPKHLEIPEPRLGDAGAVDDWLEMRAAEFSNLSQLRVRAGAQSREAVIRRNMIELVDLLAANPEILPCQAAERISRQRLPNSTSERAGCESQVSSPPKEGNLNPGGASHLNQAPKAKGGIIWT